MGDLPGETQDSVERRQQALAGMPQRVLFWLPLCLPTVGRNTVSDYIPATLGPKMRAVDAGSVSAPGASEGENSRATVRR